MVCPNYIQLSILDLHSQNIPFLHLPDILVPKEIRLLDPSALNGSLVWELGVHLIGKWAVRLSPQLLLMKTGICTRVLFLDKEMQSYGAIKLRYMKARLP